VAKAFVGSSPTSRTTTSTYPTLEDNLRSKRLAEATIESKKNTINQLFHHVKLWDAEVTKEHVEE
jgi:hypothetical protein